MYITICEVDEQFKIHVLNRALKAGALGQLRGIGWEGRWEECSGWGFHVHHGGFMFMYSKNHHKIVK